MVGVRCCWCWQWSKEVSYADAYTRSQAEIRKALPLAEELKIKIAVENVWNQFLLSPLEAARYVDEFKAPGWAGTWTWKPHHFRLARTLDPGTGKAIVKLHIKEFSRKKRDEKGLRAGFNVNFGKATAIGPAVMKALDEVGFKAGDRLSWPAEAASG